MRIDRQVVLPLIAVALLIGCGFVVPRWLMFLMTMAASHGLAVLGVVVLTRGGGATFGQGLFFAVGAYSAAFATMYFGVTDALVRVVAGGTMAGVMSALVAPLLARYRGIFFAMLTLALSMVAYGILSKFGSLGGTDGFSLARPTFFGYVAPTAHVEQLLYALTIVVASAASAAVWVYFRSSAGLVSFAARNSTLRVEYLGASPSRSLARDFTICSVLGGLGGALTGLSLGHVDPQFGYWTTSGEFVFAAILGGYQSAVAAFIAAFILEIVRSFSSLYFPNAWQLVLGLFLLLVVVIRPDGIGSLWARRSATKSRAEALAASSEASGGGR